MARIFLPNREIDRTTSLILTTAWFGAAALAYVVLPFDALPAFGEILAALKDLWFTQGMGRELFTTLKLISTALAITVVSSILLAYLTTIWFFRPLVHGISRLRFLGITGLVLPFTLVTGGGFELKVVLLTFGMATFFVTAMAAVVEALPREQFDYMRALGASEARIMWEVVILGTLSHALDITRQNLAIGWVMITMVEGISRSEGGLGAMILNQNKHFKIAEVYAILIVILIVGLLLDYIMGVITRIVCPYAHLEKVHK